ncbi:MAG: hypothetical protein ABIJ96_00010 [Elusimicrobiota bacterium]
MADDKEKEEKKKGAAPISGYSTTAKSALESALGQGPAVVGGGGGSAAAGKGLAGLIVSITKSPIALGLLIGAAAVGAGYGIVEVMKPAASGRESAVNMNLPTHGDGGEMRSDLPSGVDSVEQFAGANKGAMGSAEQAHEMAEADDAPADAPDSGLEIDDPSKAPLGADAAKLSMENLMKGAGEDGKKKDGDEGKGGIGTFGSGGATSGASLSVGGLAGMAGKAGKAGALPDGDADKGKLSQGKRSSRAVLASGNTGRGGSGGASALRQVEKSAALSKFAAATDGEQAHYTADGAFTGAEDPIGGNATPIDGSGLTSSGGQGLSEGMDSFKASDSGKAFGNRQGKTGSDEVDCDASPNHKDCIKGNNVTPWQDMSDMAAQLLKLAGIMLLIATICALLGKFPLFSWLLPVAVGFGYAAAALGAIVGLMGVAMIAMGQKGQGTIYTMLGTLTAIFGVMAAKSARAEITANAEAAMKKAAEEKAKEELLKKTASDAAKKASEEAATEAGKTVAKDAGQNAATDVGKNVVEDAGKESMQWTDGPGRKLFPDNKPLDIPDQPAKPNWNDISRPNSS